MLYGSAIYNRMEKEYENKLDAGDDYYECPEDCENCKFINECEWRKEEND